jgi:glycine/D-amino acid oxidase-like deaminating enzyme
VSGRCDVAVIGAGLIGCAAALNLARRGRRVVVLDQGEINRGASGRNAGSLHFQIEPRMVDVLLSDPQRLAELIPVNLQAIEDWKRVPAELKCDPEIAMHGGLMLAETDAEHELLLRKLDLETRAGLTVRVLDAAELHRIAPYLSERIRFASFCPDEGHANPRLVVAAYAAAARAEGVVFQLRARVESMEPHAGGWRLASRASSEADAAAHPAEIFADAVLIAAGAWSREILRPLGVEVPLTAVGLQMMVTQRAPQLIGHLVQHMGRRISIKQLEAGNILIGGGWPALLRSPDELGYAADAELQEMAMIGSAAVACHTVPATSELSVIRSWSGIACVAPDHLPVLGAIDSLPGLFIAAGGASFTLGPTYARLISELISEGSASMPIGLYRAGRFAQPQIAAVH